MTTIGEKIKAQRKALGLTQTELGAKLGVQKNAVSKWECGRVDDIPSSKIKAMAQLFGVQPSFLIDDAINALPSPSDLPADEHQLLSLYRDLNDEGQEKLIDYADDLVSSDKYKKYNTHQLDKKA